MPDPRRIGPGQPTPAAGYYIADNEFGRPAQVVPVRAGELPPLPKGLHPGADGQVVERANHFDRKTPAATLLHFIDGVRHRVLIHAELSPKNLRSRDRITFFVPRPWAEERKPCCYWACSYGWRSRCRSPC
jgi:hypothetical protein